MQHRKFIENECTLLKVSMKVWLKIKKKGKKKGNDLWCTLIKKFTRILKQKSHGNPVRTLSQQ